MKIKRWVNLEDFCFGQTRVYGLGIYQISNEIVSLWWKPKLGLWEMIEIYYKKQENYWNWRFLEWERNREHLCLWDRERERENGWGRRKKSAYNHESD